MIVNDQNEVIACRLLPRDIGQEELFFSALLIHRCPLWVSIHCPERDRTVQNRKKDYSTFTESVFV